MATTKPVRPGDPSHNFLRAEASPLEAIFSPASVAVIGASEREGSVGRTVLWNLAHGGFRGALYAVNPKRDRQIGRAHV